MNPWSWRTPENWVGETEKPRWDHSKCSRMIIHGKIQESTGGNEWKRLGDEVTPAIFRGQPSAEVIVGLFGVWDTPLCLESGLRSLQQLQLAWIRWNFLLKAYWLRPQKCGLPFWSCLTGGAFEYHITNDHLPFSPSVVTLGKVRRREMINNPHSACLNWYLINTETIASGNSSILPQEWQRINTRLCYCHYAETHKTAYWDMFSEIPKRNFFSTM